MNKNKWFLNGGRGSGKTFRLLWETYENKIANLEKENAELKHTTATLRQEKDNVSMHAKAMEVVAKTKSDQLTKAKEIMKHLLDWQYDEYKKSETDKELFKVIGEAEQFLSEEVG